MKNYLSNLASMLQGGCQMSQREFQLIEKPTSEAQKTINQWRHEYELEIVSVQASAPGYVVIAVWRTKK